MAVEPHQGSQHDVPPILGTRLELRKNGVFIRRRVGDGFVYAREGLKDFVGQDRHGGRPGEGQRWEISELTRKKDANSTFCLRAASTRQQHVILFIMNPALQP